MIHIRHEFLSKKRARIISLVIIQIVLLIVSAVIIRRSREVYLKTEKENFLEHAQIVAASLHIEPAIVLLEKEEKAGANRQKFFLGEKFNQLVQSISDTEYFHLVYLSSDNKHHSISNRRFTELKIDQHLPMLKLVFQGQKLIQGPYMDHGQKLIAALAPVRSEDNQKIIGAIVLEQEYDHFYSAVRKGLFFSLVLFGLFEVILLVFVFWILYTSSILWRVQESEMIARAFMENNFDGMLIHQNNQMLEFNESLVNIFGYSSREEIESKSILDLVVPGSREIVERRINENFQGLYKVECLKKDGTVFLAEVLARSILFKGQPTRLSFIRDITEHARIAQEREDLLKKLTQAKLAAEAASNAKTVFLSNMSHEIRTPLNSVIGLTDLLLEAPLSSEQKDYLQTIQQAGEALLELINNILEISRIESGNIVLEYKQFDLTHTIREAVDILIPRAGSKNIQLHLNINPSIPRNLLGDPLRLRQILLNLISNAIKFTHEGLVRLDVDPVQFLRERSQIRFTVSDTGIGIPAEKQHELFHRFSQLDNSITKQYGGSGLGLSISKELTELMKGTIRFQSEPGKGTVFTLLIPFDLPTGVIPDKQQKLSDPPKDHRSLHILLVEDSEDNRLLIQVYFKGLPYRLDFAEDGQEAIDKFKADSYDLVLMDLQMPVMDGYTATRTIRSFEKENVKPPTPIIALTAYALAEERERSLQSGCNVHLTKPIKKPELLRVILEQTGFKET